MKNVAIILAAGVGSRLMPITQKMPKSLVRVSGKEIIEWQFTAYAKAGIKEENMIVVTGYKAAQFREFLSKNHPKAHIIENAEYLETNNMYSLFLALNFAKKNMSDFSHLIINNADCIYDEKIILDLVNFEAENAIACDAGTFIEESMKISLDEKGKIFDIAKTIEKSKSYAVSIDLYKFSKNASEILFEILRDFIVVKNDKKQWSEVAFLPLFKKIAAYPFDISHKKWVEVDNVSDLLEADKKFSQFDFASKKAFVLDLDGTVFVGNKPIFGAVDFIKRNAKRFDFYFLTNNTSKTPAEYAKKLKGFGLECDEEKIATPLYPLIEYLKKFKSVFLVANDNVLEFVGKNLEGVELCYMPCRNEAVVLTYDTEIDYKKLERAARLLSCKNIEYIATHTDAFCPTECGNIPDIGGFIETLRLATKRVPDKVFGKPDAFLIKKIVEKYGQKNVAVAGDRLYTDLRLAQNAGVDFIAVLSGEVTRFDVAMEKQCKFVYKDLGEIDRTQQEKYTGGGYSKLTVMLNSFQHLFRARSRNKFGMTPIVMLNSLAFGGFAQHLLQNRVMRSRNKFGMTCSRNGMTHEKNSQLSLPNSHLSIFNYQLTRRAA